MKILIIGGTGGIGSELAKLLYANDPEQQPEIMAVGSEQLDITDVTRCHTYASVYEHDVVIVCAGINKDGMIHNAINDLDGFNKLIDINIKGSVNIATAFTDRMRKRGYGRLIYISSVLSTKTVLGTGIYSASKAFVDKLVQNISAENASKGVTCNSIQLGYFDAGMTHRLDPEKAAAIKESIPTKRWGRISELANVIEMIIETEYLTGANIKLDGGI